MKDKTVYTLPEAAFKHHDPRDLAEMILFTARDADAYCRAMERGDEPQMARLSWTPGQVKSLLERIQFYENQLAEIANKDGDD